VKRFKKINNQNGAAMVEFAFILPLLLILICGVIEFGVMFYDKAVITNASREGVRAGITGLGDSEIKQIVLNYCNVNLVNLGSNDDALDPDKIFISEEFISEGKSDLTVRLEYRYDFLISSIYKFYAPHKEILNTTISAETVMRIE
jgi:hypothetical protein